MKICEKMIINKNYFRYIVKESILLNYFYLFYLYFTKTVRTHIVIYVAWHML